MSKNYSFGVWLDEWLKVYKKPFLKSIRNQKSILRNHVPQYVKAMRLDHIDVVALQRSINCVPYSRTRLDVYDLYHGALKTAYKLFLVPYDVSEALVKPKHVRKGGEALTADEVALFLDAITGTRLETYYLFCLYTGCRRSEALNVKWDDVDFENNVIYVHGTKTERSERIVPLFENLKDVLLERPRVDDKIFHHRAEFVSRKFKTYCPNHKLHDLRHTYATSCLTSNINIKVVQKWLGHSRLETTAEIYTHVQSEYERREAEKFNLLGDDARRTSNKKA